MNLPLQDLLGGKYEILDKIAEGGIGSIYKVRHQLLGQVRVIKVLRAQVAEREDLQERLMREAKTAIRLRHPNIAELYDLAVAEDGTAYIVMEFIDGVSLEAVLSSTGPPSVGLNLEIAKQALSALGYLHEAGFIHRDISPDNLMLTRDFEKRARIKLIDLGIAKDLAETSGVTAVGTFLGKVKYCPPELFQSAEGATGLDERSDNYSLGVTLYELVTGRHPFTGETFEELAAAHLFREPLSFDETDPEGKVPPELRQIILGAIDKDPDGRPATAEEFRARLDRFEIDQSALTAEVDGILDDPGRFSSKSGEYKASGSTQEHLDEQFGVEATSVVNRREETEPARPEKEVDAPERADTVLDDVPPDARTRTGGGVPTWAKAAVAVLVAVPLVALAIWSLRRAPTSPPAPARQSTVSIEPAARFDPAAPGGIGDALLLPTEAPQEGQPAAAPVGEDLRSREASRVAEPEETREPPTEEVAPPSAEPSGATPIVARPIEMLKAGPGVTPPRLLEALEPSYPKPEKREIVITIRALVSETGEVVTAAIKTAPSFKRHFKEAALAAANDARFEPATKDGVAGKMWTEVEVRFLP